jgi:Ca2+-binding RTX toxin-like protein
VRTKAVLVLVGTLVLLLAPLPPASSTFTDCIHLGSGTHFTLRIADDVRIFVTETGEFKWEDVNTNIVSDCGDGTVSNTDAFTIADDTDGSSTPTVIIDLRRKWQPGATLEKNSISEIEIDVDLNVGTADELRIFGGARKDRIVWGAEGANLNRDNDIDLTVQNTEFFFVRGRGKADLLSASGGFGTGDHAAFPVEILGDAGPDTLVGGDGPDSFRGLDGGDEILGQRGKDRMFGDDGDDLLRGGLGADELDGMKGRDRLRGQKGPDDLEGGPGDDDLEGGPGIDTCNGGPGTDSIGGCEN